MRLGELLVGTGAITENQLDEALRAQVMWGGRLGTNLVELGHITLDELSRGIGRLLDVPAALDSHFARADRELQRQLPVELAQIHSCLPLLRAGKRIVIASMAPLDDRSVALVAGQLDINRQMIVQSVAAEMRIRYQLELVYGIPRGQRFMRVRGVTNGRELLNVPEVIPAERPRRVTNVQDLEPALELEIDEASLPITRDSRRERRAYVQTLADMLQSHPDKQPVLDAIARARRSTPPRPFAIGSTQMPLIELAVADVLPEALADIELAPSRDELARRVIGTVARYVPESRSVMLLVVRGTAAITEMTYSRDGSDVPALAVPLDHPGLVAAVMRRKAITRGASGDLGPVDYLLLNQLGVQFGDLVVAPLVIAGHVFGAIVLATEQRAGLESLQAITSATSAAFARLMRDAPGLP